MFPQVQDQVIMKDIRRQVRGQLISGDTHQQDQGQGRGQGQVIIGQTEPMSDRMHQDSKWLALHNGASQVGDPEDH